MKLSGGFDARRLRNREATDWRWRWACLSATLLMLAGLALVTLGSLALLSNLEPLTELRASLALTVSVLLLGVLLMASSLLLRRRSRRRRFQNGCLSLAPHLLRKHG